MPTRRLPFLRALVLLAVTVFGAHPGAGAVSSDVTHAAGPEVFGMESFASSGAPVALQDGTTLTPFATGESFALVEDAFCAAMSSCVTPRLLLERIPLATGESFGPIDIAFLPGISPSRGPELYFVESGEVVLTSDYDESTGEFPETLYSAGEQIFVPAMEEVDSKGNRYLDFESYQMHNDANEPACLLRFSLGEWSPQLGGFQSDVTGASVPSCRGYQMLAVGDDTAWPAAPANLVLAQLMMEPGSSLGPVAYTGPMAIASDSGTVGLSYADGRFDDLYRGDQGVVIPAGTPHELIASGAEPVAAIVAMVIPVGLNPEAPLDPATGLLSPDALIPRAEPSVDTSTYTSPMYGYSLSWDSSWSVEGLSSTIMHNQLDLLNDGGYVYLTSYDGFSGDAGMCLDAATVRLEQEGQYDYVQVMQDENGQFIEGQEEGLAYRLLVFGQTGYEGRLYVECRTLIAGQAVLEIKADLFYEDYESQLQSVSELLGGLTLP